MIFLKPKKKPKAVKFLLAPRSQKDPLAADFEAPHHVLVPKDGDVEKAREKFPDFDPKVFPSKEESKTGMLERAHNADGITFDSDLLQAMSKDFDYADPNNVLDDDFLDQAGGLMEDDEGELMDINEELFGDEPEVITFNHSNQDEVEDSDDIDDQDSYDDEDETKSVFTNYSMTSSIMRRAHGLQQIDEHFERLFEKEYADDTEIGPLDLNEVKGEELLTNIDQIRQLKKEIKSVRKRNHGDDYEPEIVSEHHKNAIIGDEPGAEDEDLVEVEIRRRENRVDCESILTYNSNLYNHPKLIVEPRRKTTSQNTTDQMEVTSDSKSVASSRATVLSKLSIRPSNETNEEKKARKKALRQYRHERRQERKQNQQIFKTEHANLIKQQSKNLAALKLA